MSMIMSLRPLEQYQLEAIRADEQNMDHYLFADLSAPKPGLLARLFGFGRKSTPKPPLPDWAPLDDSSEGYLDKAWHGIHFMLTGTDWEGDWPLNFLLKGGREIGPDLGYGPARAINADQVKEIAAALAPIDDEELKKRFDPAKMMELAIYPTIWDRDPADDDTLGYCLEYYTHLKTCITRAAQENKAVIIIIS